MTATSTAIEGSETASEYQDGRSISFQIPARSRCIWCPAAFSFPGAFITIRSTPSAGRSSCRLGKAA
jgi:hypothetical protein